MPVISGKVSFVLLKVAARWLRVACSFFTVAVIWRVIIIRPCVISLEG